MSGENWFCIIALVVGGLVYLISLLLWGNRKGAGNDPYLRQAEFNELMRLMGTKEDEESFSEDDIEELEDLEDEMSEREALQELARMERIKHEIDRKRKREQELAAIKNDFPEWLVEFGKDFEIETYRGLVDLTKYIEAILIHAQDHFEGRLPIKRCYSVLRDGRGFTSKPPNRFCQGRTFFETLSKILSENEILTDSKGQMAKEIARDAFIKLRPASSVQRPTVQDAQYGQGTILKSQTGHNL